MSITKILSNEKTSAEEKLEAVAELVAAARKAYGNTEADVEEVGVNTAYGSIRFSMLEDDSKVEMLRGEAMAIKAKAIEAAEQNPAININKRVEELLSTNPLFANIVSSTKVDYL